MKGVKGQIYYYIGNIRKRNLRQLDDSPMFGTSSDLRGKTGRHTSLGVRVVVCHRVALRAGGPTIIGGGVKSSSIEGNPERRDL